MDQPLPTLALSTCSAEYMFVASVDSYGKILLGAFGDRYDVLNDQSTLFQAYGPFNEIYWYFAPNIAFGFAPTLNISLSPCDQYDSVDSYRMSWILDSNQGGCRVGSLFDLGNHSNIFKVAYACKYTGTCTLHIVSI